MKWRCPYCRTQLEIASPADLPHLPFCSERCKMADLHGWLTDRYVVSRPADEADLADASPEVEKKPDDETTPE